MMGVKPIFMYINQLNFNRSGDLPATTERIAT